MLCGSKATCKALLQFGPVANKRIHEGLVLFDRRSALSLAIDVHGESGITKLCYAFGLLALIVAQAAPCMGDHDDWSCILALWA